MNYTIGFYILLVICGMLVGALVYFIIGKRTVDVQNETLEEKCHRQQETIDRLKHKIGTLTGKRD